MSDVNKFQRYLDNKSKIPGARPRNLTGMVFGELTVIDFAGKKNNNRLWWRCHCSCGAIRDVCAANLNTSEGITHVTHCGNFAIHSRAQNHKEILQRFLSKFTEKGPSECWPVKRPGYQGYKSFNVRGEKIRMHRFSYEHFIGAIPDGVEVRHKCDNPSCVNPRHLELGTHQENMVDMAVRQRGGTQKLTADHVIEIRNAPHIGYLAQRYNVSARHIRRIRDVSRRSYV